MTLAAVAVLAGACGGDDGDSEGSTTTTTEATTTTTEATTTTTAAPTTVTGNGALGEPVPPVDFIAEYGTDATFDGLADSCFVGDLAACDTLYRETPVSDSPNSYEGYGATCGGRLPEADESTSCEDLVGPVESPAPTGPVEGEVDSISISIQNGVFSGTLNVDIGDEVVTVEVNNAQSNSTANGDRVLVAPAPSGDGWVYVGPAP